MSIENKNQTEFFEKAVLLEYFLKFCRNYMPKNPQLYKKIKATPIDFYS